MIGESIAKFLKLDNLISHLTGYAETKVELIKLEVRQDLADGLGKAITWFLIAFVFAMVLLFISLGLAVFIGSEIGYLGGFAIIGGIYAIIGAILFINREKLNSKFTKEVSVKLKKK